NSTESLLGRYYYVSSHGPQALARQSHKSRLLQFSSNRGYVFTIVSYLIGVFIFATIVGRPSNRITIWVIHVYEMVNMIVGITSYLIMYTL
ncbi:hypothetical protein L9F63_019586, partial [Diploptera punctata]